MTQAVSKEDVGWFSNAEGRVVPFVFVEAPGLSLDLGGTQDGVVVTDPAAGVDVLLTWEAIDVLMCSRRSAT